MQRNPGTSSYSRNEGVATYRRRRRVSLVAKGFVFVVLVAILGGAAYLFGRQFVQDGILSFGPAGSQEAQPADESGAAQEAAAPVAVEPTRITLAGAGDVVLSGPAVESGLLESGDYDFAHLFGHLTHEIMPFDVRTVSQETSMAGSQVGFGASWPLNAPQDLGRAEVDAGFNVILRASDHTLDSGWDGVHNELMWWHDNEPHVPVIGIADPNPEENPGLSDYIHNVYVGEKDGVRYAILNHAAGIWGDDVNVVSALNEDTIAADVAMAREQGAEFIIACPHWGIENNAETSGEQTDFARVYAEQGVDVILGTGPRVLQRVEVFQNASGHKTVCFYSLGCLISSLDAANFLGGLAEVTLEKQADGSCAVQSATLKPVVTHRGEGQAFTTYLVADYSDVLAENSWDPGVNPEDLANRAREVLGDGYDAEAAELRVDLNGVTHLDAEDAPAEEQPEGEEGAEF